MGAQGASGRHRPVCVGAGGGFCPDSRGAPSRRSRGPSHFLSSAVGNSLAYPSATSRAKQQGNNEPCPRNTECPIWLLTRRTSTMKRSCFRPRRIQTTTTLQNMSGYCCFAPNLQTKLQTSARSFKPSPEVSNQAPKHIETTGHTFQPVSNPTEVNLQTEPDAC